MTVPTTKKMRRTTLGLLVLALVLAAMSCKDTKMEQEQLDKNLDKIESVEQSTDQTMQEVDKKAMEAKKALSELDSI